MGLNSRIIDQKAGNKPYHTNVPIPVVPISSIIPSISGNGISKTSKPGNILTNSINTD